MDSSIPKVLVLDANQRSALAIIRSLGRRGINVIAGDHRAHSLGGASRFSATSVRYSDPARSAQDFANDVKDISERLGIDTIIPATDLTTMLIVSQSDLFKNVHLAAPDLESYDALSNKARLLEIAKNLEIPAPESHVVQSPKDAIDTASDFGFPVVLKPARSRYIKGGCVFSTSVQIAPSAEKLKALLESLPWVGDIPCIVQRFVPGHGAGIFALYGPSGPIAWFSHRRIREKPPAGGVSVLCESVPVDTLMRSLSERLLSAVNWKGVAMVEFRVSDAGTPYLMEVNGRFWGSLQLAVDCDVDFPWLLYQTAHQVPVTGPSSYLIGHRLRWLLGDLDSLFIRVRRDSSTSRQRFRAVCDFLRSFGDIHCRQEIFRLNDPAPALREFRQWLRAARGGK